ncbi:MAG: Fe2+-dependent dioxygenase [Pseudomonadota bacterium]
MPHHLAQVLTPDELEQIRALCVDEDAFAPGERTAGWAARPVKSNLQMKPGGRLDAVRRIVEPAMRRHPVFTALALPKSTTGLLVNRHQAGMHYGRHVDDALIGRVRADLSFTVFLSPPDSYRGGALILHGVDGETAIKADAGDAVIYDTGELHEVAPVTDGERTAVVGWVRSYVRSAEQRAILFDLDRSTRAIIESHGRSEAIDHLIAARTNLLRMWAED